MNKSTIEKELEQNGWHLQTTVGDSMYPMLKNRESMVRIEKLNRPLKKYDLPLYRRPDGKYVLHRIIHIRKTDCLTCGDNRWRKEIVPVEWIIGIVTSYYHSGTWISVTDKQYQQYLKTLSFRRKYLWLKSLSGRIQQKCRRMSNEK